MDRTEVIAQIYAAGETLSKVNDDNNDATWTLIEHAVRNRSSMTILKAWLRELEGMTKRAQEAKGNG